MEERPAPVAAVPAGTSDEDEMLSAARAARLRLGLIGSGLVGATFAYTVLLRGLASEIVILDINRDKAEGDVMDLNHALPFAQPAIVRTGDYPDLAGVDVVVIAAGAAQKPGETRLDLVRKNTQIFRDIIARLAAVNPHAVLVIATNPVDVLTYVSWKLSGFPAHRVIGSGTLLDSARLRFLLGRHCGVDPRSVHAYIVGEHGDSELAVWSLTTVGGVPLRQMCPRCGRACEPRVWENIFRQVRDAAYEIIKRKGATYYAIAASLARIVESIGGDQHSVLTVSAQAGPELLPEAPHVFLGVPAVVGRSGVERVLPLPLSGEEKAAFERSGRLLAEVIASLEREGLV